MDAGVIKEVLDRVPFAPFRVTLTDGSSYKVVDPGLCYFHPHYMIVVKMPRSNPPHLARDIHRAPWLALEHIVKLDFLPTAPARPNLTTFAADDADDDADTA